MQPVSSQHLPCLLNQTEAAEFLGLSPRTLERWRVVGGGPLFIKLRSGAIRYRPSDLMTFVEASTKRHTHDSGAMAKGEAK